MNSKVNKEPFSISESTDILPLRAKTFFLTIDNPNPEPERELTFFPL